MQIIKTETELNQFTDEVRDDEMRIRFPVGSELLVVGEIVDHFVRALASANSVQSSLIKMGGGATTATITSLFWTGPVGWALMGVAFGIGALHVRQAVRSHRCLPLAHSASTLIQAGYHVTHSRVGEIVLCRR